MSQFFFMVTAAVTGGNLLGSVVMFRVLLILAETGTFFLLKRYCQHVGVDPRRISWYWLNPLVILEITGNLHFEGFMIFFLFLSILMLESNRYALSAVGLAMAIGVKLIPLIFLPILWKRMGTRKFIRFMMVLVLALAVIILPFLDQAFFTGMGNSLGLYFKKFEFNASIYYLVREVGFWVKGYNIIATAGPYLAVVTFLFILGYSFIYPAKRTGITTAMGVVLTLYLFMATTVHPWYLILLVTLMLFQNFHYPVLWTGLATLSYMGYTLEGYQENFWLIAVEYVLVVVYMGYEFVYRKKDRIFVYDS